MDYLLIQQNHNHIVKLVLNNKKLIHKFIKINFLLHDNF